MNIFPFIGLSPFYLHTKKIFKKNTNKNTCRAFFWLFLQLALLYLPRFHLTKDYTRSILGTPVAHQKKKTIWGDVGRETPVSLEE